MKDFSADNRRKLDEALVRAGARPRFGAIQPPNPWVDPFAGGPGMGSTGLDYGASLAPRNAPPSRVDVDSYLAFRSGEPSRTSLTSAAQAAEGLQPAQPQGGPPLSTARNEPADSPSMPHDVDLDAAWMSTTGGLGRPDWWPEHWDYDEHAPSATNAALRPREIEWPDADFDTESPSLDGFRADSQALEARQRTGVFDRAPWLVNRPLALARDAAQTVGDAWSIVTNDGLNDPNIDARMTDRRRTTGDIFTGIPDFLEGVLDTIPVEDTTSMRARSERDANERRDIERQGRLIDAHLGQWPEMGPDEGLSPEIIAEVPRNYNRADQQVGRFLNETIGYAADERSQEGEQAYLAARDAAQRAWEAGDDEAAAQFTREARMLAAGQGLDAGFAGLEFTGAGLVRDLGRAAVVSPARATARTVLNRTGRDIPDFLLPPQELERLAAQGVGRERAYDAPSELTQQGRGFARAAVAAPAAAVGVDALDSELGDDPLASAIGGGAALAALRPGFGREALDLFARDAGEPVLQARRYQPSQYVEIVIHPDGQVEALHQGAYQSSASDARVLGSGREGAEALSTMRGALQALQEDIATVGRQDYSWTPGPPGQRDERLANFYRDAMQTHTPPGYVFSETDDGVMHLSRIEPAETVPYGSALRRDGEIIDDPIDWEAPNTGYDIEGLMPPGGRLMSGVDPFDAPLPPRSGDVPDAGAGARGIDANDAAARPGAGDAANVSNMESVANAPVVGSADDTSLFAGVDPLRDGGPGAGVIRGAAAGGPWTGVGTALTAGGGTTAALAAAGVGQNAEASDGDRHPMDWTLPIAGGVGVAGAIAALLARGRMRGAGNAAAQAGEDIGQGWRLANRPEGGVMISRDGESVALRDRAEAMRYAADDATSVPTVSADATQAEYEAELRNAVNTLQGDDLLERAVEWDLDPSQSPEVLREQLFRAFLGENPTVAALDDTDAGLRFNAAVEDAGPLIVPGTDAAPAPSAPLTGLDRLNDDTRRAFETMWNRDVRDAVQDADGAADRVGARGMDQLYDEAGSTDDALRDFDLQRSWERAGERVQQSDFNPPRNRYNALPPIIAAGAGGAAGAAALAPGEANAFDGDPLDDFDPTIPILGGVSAASLAAIIGRRPGLAREFDNVVGMSGATARREPAPRMLAAVRDPETGRVFTGLDHHEAIDAAPEALRPRLQALYDAEARTPSPDVGFDLNGQFFDREAGMAELSRMRGRGAESQSVNPQFVGREATETGTDGIPDPLDGELGGTRVEYGHGKEAVVRELEAAIERGEPISNAEIARRTGLTTRTVHVYRGNIRAGRNAVDRTLQRRLDAAEEALGDVKAEARANSPFVQEMRRLQADGLTLTEAAEEIGLGYDNLAQHATRHGIKFRDGRLVVGAEARNAGWLADNQAGMTFRQIAARDGVGVGMVAGGIKTARGYDESVLAAARGQTSDTADTAARLGIPEERVRGISAVSSSPMHRRAGGLRTDPTTRRTDLPTTVYHATIDNVDGPLRGDGMLGPGAYSSQDPRIAEAMLLDEETGLFPEGANIVPERVPSLDRYVPMEQVEQDLFNLARAKGYDIDDPKFWNSDTEALQQQLLTRYQEQGYAGIHDPNYAGGLGQIVTWEGKNRRAPWARMLARNRNSSDPLSAIALTAGGAGAGALALGAQDAEAQIPEDFPPYHIRGVDPLGAEYGHDLAPYEDDELDPMLRVPLAAVAGLIGRGAASRAGVRGLSREALTFLPAYGLDTALGGDDPYEASLAGFVPMAAARYGVPLARGVSRELELPEVAGEVGRGIESAGDATGQWLERGVRGAGSANPFDSYPRAPTGSLPGDHVFRPDTVMTPEPVNDAYGRQVIEMVRRGDSELPSYVYGGEARALPPPLDDFDPMNGAPPTTGDEGLSFPVGAFDPQTGAPLFGDLPPPPAPPRGGRPRRPFDELAPSGQARRIGPAPEQIKAARDLGVGEFATGRAAMEAIRQRAQTDPAFMERLRDLYPSIAALLLAGAAANGAGDPMNSAPP